MEQRITTNFEDIGSNTLDITQLELQYRTLTDTLQAVGIVNTEGTTVSTPMNLNDLNSNILRNESNIIHFNHNVETLFTSQFAEILDNNTSNLNDQALQRKIEGIHFDNLHFGEGKDFNAFSNDIYKKINSLTTDLSSTSSTSGTLSSYFNTNNSDISIQNGKSLIVGGETNLKIGNETLYEYLNNKNYQQAKPAKFCFDNDLCIKPCGNILCIEKNNTTTKIWDHNQATSPRY
jgi:CII-binding regulator of phage lambda lysogenization HflD